MVRALALVAASFVTISTLAAHAPSRAADCKGLDAAAGTWRFSTLVTEAKVKANKGVIGYYQLTLTAEGCKLRAALTKTGYGKKTFKPDKMQTATAEVVADTIPPMEDNVDPSELRPGETLLKFQVTLKGGGVELPMSFEIIATKDGLVGRWQYEGEAWQSAAMAGVLVGARGEGPAPELRKHTDIGCARVCDLEGYYYESNSRNSCSDACGEGHLPRASHHE